MRTLLELMSQTDPELPINYVIYLWGFFLHTAQQLCRSLLLGILLRSEPPAQAKAKSTLIFLVGPSVVKRGRPRHAREFNFEKRSYGGQSQLQGRLVLLVLLLHLFYGCEALVGSKSRLVGLLFVASQRRQFHSCVDGGQSGCYCGPSQPQQAPH